MAVEYARHRFAAAGLEEVVSDSAGTLGIEGERASREAGQVLREAGLDLSLHRSKGLEGADPCGADLVIGMERSHLDEVGRRCGAGAPRRLLLRAFESGPDPREGAPELDDPIGGPIEEYRECFATIRICVDHIADHLRNRT